MKRILLVYPPYERFSGGSFPGYPIGLGYLATMLRIAGYDSMIYNADFPPMDTLALPSGLTNRLDNHHLLAQNALDFQNSTWQEVRKLLEDYKPDLLGIYTTTVTLPIVLAMAGLAKELNRDCVTVLGGPHVTLMPDQVMEHRNVDFILMGEAEHTLIELCRELENKGNQFSKISGLGYRVDGRVSINREYEFIDDLDSLPLVDHDLVLNEEAFPKDMLGGTILGSRGCPFRCTFCASSAIWKRHIRFRSVESLVAELEYLKAKYRLASFYFADDTFTSNRLRVAEFCQQLIDKKLHLSWTCLTRCDTINESLPKLLKRAGCQGILAGVESGSDKVLKAMKKGIRVKTVRRAAELTRKHGLRFGALFVVGLPYETTDDVRKTIDLIEQIAPDSVNVSTFFPYPGTEAHAEVVKHGLLPENYDWAENLNLGHHSPNNCFTPYIPKEEFRELVYQISRLADKYNEETYRKTVRRHWNQRHFYLSNPAYVIRKASARLKESLGRVLDYPS